MLTELFGGDVTKEIVAATGFNASIGIGFVYYVYKRISSFITKVEAEELIKEKIKTSMDMMRDHMESTTELMEARLKAISDKLDLILKDAHIEFRK
jgi:hypothetical protein